MLIKSERIYFEDGPRNGYLEIENGKFFEYYDNTEADNYIDYGNNRIIPGIFDTHNHGTCGYSLMGIEGEKDKILNVKGYLKGCASQGVTSVFPTPGTDMLRTVAEFAGNETDGAAIVGIHSEGPWLNRTGEKGIRTLWPKVSLKAARQLVEDGQGKLKLVALAPEIPGINEVIDYLLSEGITVAFAHSDCGYKEAMAAYDRGLSVSTHTGNVMTGMHHRDVGGLGAALLHNKADCEVICDGMHVSLEMLQIYFKVKDTKRFMMVSDCTSFSGAPVGSYKAWGDVGGMIVTKEGFVLTDTGRLMGSSQPVLFGIKNLVENLKLPMETVLFMSSLNACRKYGLDKYKGSIKLGKDADFVVINDDYEAMETFVKGRKVYDRNLEGSIFNPEFYAIMKQ